MERMRFLSIGRREEITTGLGRHLPECWGAEEVTYVFSDKKSGQGMTESFVFLAGLRLRCEPRRAFR